MVGKSLLIKKGGGWSFCVEKGTRLGSFNYPVRALVVEQELAGWGEGSCMEDVPLPRHHVVKVLCTGR